MIDSTSIRAAAQNIRDRGVRLGTGNPGHDLTDPLADLLDRYAADARHEAEFGGVRGFHTPQLDRLIASIETAVGKW